MKPIPIVLATMLLLPAALAAQNYREVEPSAPPRATAGINLQLGIPQGEFADFVETGYGIGANLSYFLDRSRRAGLRLFFSWLQYGRATERVPVPGLPGIAIDLTTSNNIYSFGLGPEFQLGAGALKPYAQAGLGTSYFATRTSADATDSGNSFASTTNFDDWTFAWFGGGGLMYQVSHGRNPIFLDGGVRYQSHGRTRYLREGSIQTDAGGNVIVSPIESRTDLLIVHLGIQVGF